MAADAGGARFIKDEKKLVTTKKLKDNEVSMLFILAIIAVAVLGIYFVLYPMFTKMNSLTEQIDELKATESEYKFQIAQTEIFQQQYEAAKLDYNKYFSYFHSPMDPEIIDERITSMLIDHKMTPAALSMTTLNVEGVPPYFADELRANPVPEPIGPEDEAPAEDTPAAGAEDPYADEEQLNNYNEEAAQAAGNVSYAFVYTVNVSAYGERDNLYTFLAQVAPMTAMHVMSFDFTDPTSTRGEDGKTTVTPGQINMQIKMYVLIDGVPARGFDASGQ